MEHRHNVQDSVRCRKMDSGKTERPLPAAFVYILEKSGQRPLLCEGSLVSVLGMDGS